MNNNYASPKFTGNEYSPKHGGTIGGGESSGLDFNPNSKKTMVGGNDVNQNASKKRITQLTGFLVSFSNSELGEYWELREGNNSIGTGNANEIKLSEKHVSGDHAVINIYKNPNENCWIFDIADKSSSNGTFINGERLRIYTGCTLKNNDKIQIGEYVFMLYIVDKFQNKLEINPQFVGNEKSSGGYADPDWFSQMNNTTKPGY
jgi:pSer/pThr/pTyr-binding forkhead associated (FHA) protein